MIDPAEVLDISVGAFVAELATAGVRHVSMCPGSRSTPLAIKLAQQPGIKVWMHLDERSASYFGLGLARVLREPVALLATSGTAAANFYPAIIEASLSRLPLVVLTADRPHELRDNGAAQTIDQLRLYGGHVKWFFDLPEPDASVEHLRLVRTLAARSVATARAEPAGPVHLNWPFRDPLVPRSRGPASPATRDPYVSVHTPELAPARDLVSELGAELRETHGVIVCGPQTDPDFPAAVAGLARRLGVPILADPLSGVRCGGHDRSLVVDTYDAFLRDAAIVAQLEPEVVIRFGALPTSKPLVQFAERSAHTRQIVVDPGGWRDPSGLAGRMLHVEPRLLCAALADELRDDRPSASWADQWTTLNTASRRAMDDHLQRSDELFEGRVFAELGPLLPDGALVFAGNSMPVRDLDTFWRSTEHDVRFLSNRGANGIDGVVSSALGASAAGIGPVVLVIGDVSFYHDLNGLLAARQHALNLLVVLVNNDGGGIFSFLPQADQASAHFEMLFGTPHGLEFRPFVEGHGGHFARAQSWPAFAGEVRAGLAGGGLQVVELQTDRARNVQLHRQVWRAVAEAVGPAAALTR